MVSIHAPWEGCDSTRSLRAMFAIVSIHAPWEGCDRYVALWVNSYLSFNSRTLGRVRPALAPPAIPAPRFQFTHPGKGATEVILLKHIIQTFQFTHPGKGATRVTEGVKGIFRRVSIHAPWEGCDSRFLCSLQAVVVSIHAPWEGCDDTSEESTRARSVSIHAPWEGCDLTA